MKFFKSFHLIKKLIQGKATPKDKLSLTLRIVGSLSAIGTLFLLFILGMSVVAVLLVSNSSNSAMNSMSMNRRNAFHESVLRWEPYVRREAEINEIPHAVYYLLTIITLETRGDAERFPDIMQSSESQGLPPFSFPIFQATGLPPLEKSHLPIIKLLRGTLKKGLNTSVSF